MSKSHRRLGVEVAMKKISLAVIVAGTLWIVGASAVDAHGSDKKSQYDVPVASLSFLVVKDYNGKPVRNAGVVMHSVGKHDKQDRGGLELKTDAEGKASFDGVPYGKLRVQVLAPGFQTFGEDYEVNQPTMEITIKLKRPEGQYSIYENQQNEKKAPPPDPGAKPQP
jgi:Carboxypeptidase regulatory-like domain